MNSMGIRDQISKLAAEEKKPSVQYLTPEEESEHARLRQQVGAEVEGSLVSQRAFESSNQRAVARLVELDRSEERRRELAEARAGGGGGLPTQSEYEAERARGGRATDIERMLDRSAHLEKEMLDSDPRKRGT
jgi:hypothetical protein